GGDGRVDEVRRPRGPARLSGRPHPAEDVRDRQQPRRRTRRPVSPDRDGANRAFDEAIATFEEALSKIDAALAAPPSGEEAAHLNALEALADASPMMKRQNAFNAAMVNEIRHQRSFHRAVLE